MSANGLCHKLIMMFSVFSFNNIKLSTFFSSNKFNSETATRVLQKKLLSTVLIFFYFLNSGNVFRCDAPKVYGLSCGEKVCQSRKFPLSEED